jgi:hypothetical protein
LLDWQRFEGTEVAETRKNCPFIWNNYVRIEILAMVTMKRIIIWHDISFSLVKSYVLLENYSASIFRVE